MDWKRVETEWKKGFLVWGCMNPGEEGSAGGAGGGLEKLNENVRLFSFSDMLRPGLEGVSSRRVLLRDQDCDTC